MAIHGRRGGELRAGFGVVHHAVHLHHAPNDREGVQHEVDLHRKERRVFERRKALFSNKKASLSLQSR